MEENRIGDKITAKQIYTSRLTERKVTSSDDSTHWEKVNPPESTGFPHIDKLCKVLAQTPLPSKEQVAAQMGMTMKELNMLLLVHTGKSLTGFMEDYRMVLGEELLRCTGLEIRDVARCTGYSRPNFTVLFTHYYGVSPKRYRNTRQAVRFAEYYRWDDEVLKKKV